MERRFVATETDLDILRETLAADAAYPSFAPGVAQVAAKLGLHRNTVSKRLARMKAVGFFLPLVVDVPASAVDLASGRAAFVMRGTQLQDVVAALAALEGAKSVMLHPDRFAVVLVGHDDAAVEAKADLVARLTGARLVGWEARVRRAGRGRRRTARGLRVLAAIAGAGWGEAERRARELGLAERTARRELRLLADDGAFWLHPAGRLGPPGARVAYVRVPGIGRKAEAACRRLAPYALRTVRFGALHLYALGRTDAQIEERAADAGRALGLRVERSPIVAATPFLPGYHRWLRRMLEREAALLDRASADRSKG